MVPQGPGLRPHRAAVYAPLGEACTQHPATDLDRVELPAGLFSNDVHRCFLQVSGHQPCAAQMGVSGLEEGQVVGEEQRGES